MRDKLIELLKSPHKAEQLRQMGVTIGKYEDDCVEAMVADFLLAKGVILPPCKVGDTVYLIMDIKSVHRRILVTEVLHIKIDETITIFVKTYEKYLYRYATLNSDNFGKTVFLTREEAEQALKEAQDDKQ